MCVLRVLVLLVLIGTAAATFLLTQPTTIAYAGGYVPSASSAELERLVRRLCSESKPRDAFHVENLQEISDFVEKRFRESSGRTRFQEFSADGRTYRNVLSDYGPESGPVIVVGAHYDTAGALSGADDNASGVAGLIELGRILSTKRLNTTVSLAAYTLEEPPFFRTSSMGSAVHSRSLQAERKAVKLMISLEMIGYFSSAPGSQHFPAPGLRYLYPSTGNFIAVVSTPGNIAATRSVKQAMTAAAPLPVYSLNAPQAVPGVDFSDHLNFLSAGIPAVMVTDTAMNRNLAYHSAGDTADRLNYGDMAMVVDGVAAALIQAAGEPTA